MAMPVATPVVKFGGRTCRMFFFFSSMDSPLGGAYATPGYRSIGRVG
jgi:hypothetical protein